MGAAPGMEETLWMVVIGFIAGFVYAFGIGANDVANSFASSVASKSLTLKQAVYVAAVCEFGGALLLGASVTTTIRSKIFDPKLYEDEPEILILGFMTSIVTATVMLLIATHFALPVSTTHTIVGCIMGFSICAKGFDSINWEIGKQIFISWIASPGIAGVLGFLFFGFIKVFILSHENAFLRTYYLFPFILCGGLGIDIFYIVYKGFNNFTWSKNTPITITLPAAFGFGAICGVLWLWPVGPWAMNAIEKRREQRDLALQQAAEAKAQAADYEAAGGEEDDSEEGALKKTGEAEESAPEELKQSKFQKGWKSLMDNTVNQDLEKQSMSESKKAEELWDNRIDYDEDAEYLFTYVQVFTACLNSFAHGANDVANAIGPLSGMLVIYQEGSIASKSPVQKWILVYGGVGIVVGLALYGYKVMKSLGYKMTVLSPSRGSMAELASSLFVVTASFMGIPVSSTQSITGAITGIGCASGLKSVNWWFFLQVCLGWVTIFFVSVILSGGLFSMLAFSPTLLN